MNELTGMGDLIHKTWVAVGAVVGLLLLVWILRMVFGKRRGNPHFQPVACPDCGWHGQVSRYAGRCPQCNRPLGEQKARPRT
jgi:hypothetical protein